MGNYGEVATRAMHIIHLQNGTHPEKTWKQAVQEIFPDSESSRKKSCPKGAFLGLCEEGVIRGVQSGDYARSEKNKRYALAAVSLVRKDPSLVKDRKALWHKVQSKDQKQHNAQMDVLVLLWEDGHIV